MYKNKKTGVIGIIVTVIILILIVIISNIKIEDFSHLGGALSSFVMPVQNGMTYIKNKIKKNDTFFSDLTTLKEENKTLKEYVNLKDKYKEYTTVPGYVINKSTDNYSNIIVINIGSKDGVEVNKPVISDEGLVGHVISVTESTAKVQTLVDTSSAVSSVVGTAKDSLVVKGNLDNRNLLKGSYISTTATLLEGDKVETSGLGGIYPKGITIGTVKQIIPTKNLTNRYVLIEPAVNFNNLETVLVILH